MCRNPGSPETTASFESLRVMRASRQIVKKPFGPEQHQTTALTGSAQTPSLKTMDAGNVLGDSYNGHNGYSALVHPLTIAGSTV